MPNILIVLIHLFFVLPAAAAGGDPEPPHRHQHQKDSQGDLFIHVDQDATILEAREETQIDLFLFDGDHLYRGDVRWEINDDRNTLPPEFWLTDRHDEDSRWWNNEAVAAVHGAARFTGERCTEITATIRRNNRVREITTDLCLYVPCDGRRYWDQRNDSCVSSCRRGTSADRHRRCLTPESCPTDHSWSTWYGECRHDTCDRDEFWNSTRDRCTARCSSGRDWNSRTGRCERDKPDCSEGYRYDDNRGRCVSRCSSGYTWDSWQDRCVQDREDCRNGYSWDSRQGRCVQDREDCRNGYSWDSRQGRCVRDQDDDRSCTRGAHWDDRQNRCVPDQTQRNCKDRTHWDSRAGKCVPDRVQCGQGRHWDATINRCVAD